MPWPAALSNARGRTLPVSVTGVAGPEPDERGNPVGLVYFACTRKGGKCVGVKREFGDIGRSRIRYAAASEALALIGRVASAQSGI